MTDYLRTLLKVSKPNNPSCFRKNGLIGSYHTPGKRGIIYVRLSQEDLDREKENTIENEKSVLEKYTEQGIKHIEKLDRFTIDQLISKIIIGKKDENNNRPIKIFWNFTI